MRRYSRAEEEHIAAELAVQRWERSGLIDAGQAAKMKSDLLVNLRRTNTFLRLVLFVFGMAVVSATVVLAALTLDLGSQPEVTVLTMVASLLCLAAADYLVARFRLYRFGIEEALAAGGILLAGVAAGLAYNFSFLAAAVTAASAAFLVYRRFGYLYSAAAVILFLGGACFDLGQSILVERFAAMGVLLGAFVLASAKRLEMLQAVAWSGLYLTFHPMVMNGSGGFTDFRFGMFTDPGMWVIPVAGLYLAVLGKNRDLLQVSMAMALITIISNIRETWDPIVFGLLLIGIAIAIRQYLETGSGGHRSGFTASRLIEGDLSGSGSLLIQPHAAADHEGFGGGGGRSGGGGTSGSF